MPNVVEVDPSVPQNNSRLDRIRQGQTGQARAFASAALGPPAIWRDSCQYNAGAILHTSLSWRWPGDGRSYRRTSPGRDRRRMSSLDRVYSSPIGAATVAVSARSNVRTPFPTFPPSQTLFQASRKSEFGIAAPRRLPKLSNGSTERLTRRLAVPTIKTRLARHGRHAAVRARRPTHGSLYADETVEKWGKSSGGRHQRQNSPDQVVVGDEFFGHKLPARTGISCAFVAEMLAQQNTEPAEGAQFIILRACQFGSVGGLQTRSSLTTIIAQLRRLSMSNTNR